MSPPGAMPRLLAVMGSGETAPTMVKVHRQLLERMGPPPVAAVLLDTPFGFQENAREIAGRAVTYFHESLQAPIAVTGITTAEQGGGETPFADERLVSTVRDAAMSLLAPGARATRCASGREPSFQDFSSKKCCTEDA